MPMGQHYDKASLDDSLDAIVKAAREMSRYKAVLPHTGCDCVVCLRRQLGAQPFSWHE